MNLKIEEITNSFGKLGLKLDGPLEDDGYAFEYCDLPYSMKIESDVAMFSLRLPLYSAHSKIDRTVILDALNEFNCHVNYVKVVEMENAFCILYERSLAYSLPKEEEIRQAIHGMAGIYYIWSDALERLIKEGQRDEERYNWEGFLAEYKEEQLGELAC